MARSFRWSLIFGVGAVTLLIVGAQAGQDRGPKESARFVKVGPYHINPSRIDYARDDGKALVIRFGGDERERLRLSGDEAEAMRRWLDQQSSELTGSSPEKRKVLEGIDTNIQPLPNR